MERLREVQRAHKSDKITVAQAMKAFLKVERESAQSRSRTPRRMVAEDAAPQPDESREP